MTYPRSLALAAGLLLPATALADAPMPEIVVSAARAPTPVDEVASSITVITAEQIERQNKPTVAEMLRQVPGITVMQSGGIAQPASLFMRGTNSNHVLVMVDGVVLNDPTDPTDAFDFSNLSTDNIERIEVIRGPQSTLYGSQAVGGVINIIMKQGKGAPKGNAFAEYGRYNTRRMGAGSSGEIGRTSYSIQGSNGYSGGFSSFDKRYGGKERDGYDTYHLQGNIASRLTDNFTVKLNSRVSRVDTEYDLFGLDSPVPTNDTRLVSNQLGGELKLLDGRWVQELNVSQALANRSVNEDIYGYAHYWGGRDSVNWLNHFNMIPDHKVTVGAEAWLTYYKSDTTKRVSANNRALFIDDQFNITEAFFMNAGARLDDHEDFGHATTWKLAPGYRIAQTGTTLKASYGTAFKAPSLYQLFAPFSGNPDLQPERSRGYDAGFEQQLWGDKLVFGATYFQNHIRQLISFGPPPFFPSINVGTARTRGMESTLTFKPVKDWTFTANHTYTLADNIQSDTQLQRRPKHQANASAQWQVNEKADIGANLHYTGLRRDFDLSYSVSDAKAYATMDVYGNYKLTDIVTLYGRVDNVLNKHYEEVVGYGATGMAAYGGIKANF